MADYEGPRGEIRDLRFFLKNQLNGSLIDQYNFTDGLVHDQWPIVRFYTGPSGTGTEITALVVRDITADTITSASHKDPTASSGVWRQSGGTYFVRTEPQNALAFDDYYMRVSFLPTSGNTWVEDFTYEVIVPGDIDPNGDVTPEDVVLGFTTSLTPEEIQPYIDNAWEEVYAHLEDKGISDPEAYAEANGLPRSWRLSVIENAQCNILGVDLGASLAGVKSVQEGTEKITYGSSSAEGASSTDPCTSWGARLDRWLKKNAPGRQPRLGLVVKRVGHSINEPEE